MTNPDETRKFWIAVASAEHVARGRAGGFMQVCHGKAGPLRRIRRGDGVIYYSPSERMGVADGLQAFTALGEVTDAAPYEADMGGGFHPWRRDVRWRTAAPTPIRPLLDALDLTAGKRNWGAPFRYGFLAATQADFERIAIAMGA